ncbi:MAG: flagellar biosynthesis protein FlhA, partial [Armatimonadetes bacterium]|nr:flagellar biosynthesis protein FlhA [Armatimonadota bacterium]
DADAAVEAAKVVPAPAGPEAVLSLLQVDPLEIEIGHGLTRLADARVGGDLPDRVAATRREIALELGFVMPSVRIRDNIALGPNEYAIKVRGEEVGRTRIEPNMFMALSNGQSLSAVPGVPTKDPVFGLDALWIEQGLADQAKLAGYTVIEPNVMITTHLTEIVKSHASELLSRQDVNTLLENAKMVNSTVVTELVPAVLKVGDVQKVLRHLLRERVPIRDMVTIQETMAYYAERVKDTDSLASPSTRSSKTVSWARSR